MKITWVDWNSVCLSKEVGGLGVRRIRKFNNALLGKWCWRLLVDKERLCYRVLKARYGEVRGRHVSGWLQIMCNVREGVGLTIILGGWLLMVERLSFGLIIG